MIAVIKAIFCVRPAPSDSTSSSTLRSCGLGTSYSSSIEDLSLRSSGWEDRGLTRHLLRQCRLRDGTGSTCAVPRKLEKVQTAFGPLLFRSKRQHCYLPVGNDQGYRGTSSAPTLQRMKATRSSSWLRLLQ